MNIGQVLHPIIDIPVSLNIILALKYLCDGSSLIEVDKVHIIRPNIVISSPATSIIIDSLRIIWWSFVLKFFVFFYNELRSWFMSEILLLLLFIGDPQWSWTGSFIHIFCVNFLNKFEIPLNNYFMLIIVHELYETLEVTSLALLEVTKNIIEARHYLLTLVSRGHWAILQRIEHGSENGAIIIALLSFNSLEHQLHVWG